MVNFRLCIHASLHSYDRTTSRHNICFGQRCLQVNTDNEGGGIEEFTMQYLKEMFTGMDARWAIFNTFPKYPYLVHTVATPGAHPDETSVSAIIDQYKNVYPDDEELLIIVNVYKS